MTDSPDNDSLVERTKVTPAQRDVHEAIMDILRKYASPNAVTTLSLSALITGQLAKIALLDGADEDVVNRVIEVNMNTGFEQAEAHYDAWQKRKH